MFWPANAQSRHQGQPSNECLIEGDGFARDQIPVELFSQFMGAGAQAFQLLAVAHQLEKRRFYRGGRTARDQPQIRAVHKGRHRDGRFGCQDGAAAVDRRDQAASPIRGAVGEWQRHKVNCLKTSRYLSVSEVAGPVNRFGETESLDAVFQRG